MSFVRSRAAVGALALAVTTIGGAWAFGAAPAAAAGAARYVATSGTDASNDCSSSAHPCQTIQHAVDQSNDNDTIHIGAGTYAESVLVSVAEDDSDNLTFVGAGAGKTKITGNPAVSGDVSFGIEFEGLSGSVRDLTAGGVKRIGTGDDAKPAVGVIVEPFGDNEDIAPSDAPSITIVDSNLSGNGDAGFVGEGVQATISGTTLDDNGSAGAEAEDCGIFIEGTLAMTDSSSSGNSYCGVFAVGGELIDRAARRADASADPGLSIVGSTIAGNADGGVYALGESAASVYDSTLSGNGATALAAIFGTVDVTHSTIADTKKVSSTGPDDDAPQGAILVSSLAEEAVPARAAKAMRHFVSRRDAVRLRPAAAAPASAVTLAGSIVADNAVPDCSSKVTDGGYDISGDKANSCGLSTAKHSLTKTNPKLGSLGSHGGLTQTQLPLKGSPAIDAQPSGAGCASGDVDQRGVARPQPSGGRCDIGSVELAGSKLAITTNSLPHGTVGKSYSAAVHATGGQYPTYDWSHVSGTLPPGITFHSNGTFTGTPGEAGTYTVTVSVNDPVAKTYTIVIAAASDHGNGTGNKLADTGVPMLQILALGVLLLVAGLAAMYQAELIALPRGRHRRRTG